MTELNTLATLVDTAAAECGAIVQLSQNGHALSLPDAYAVQAASIQRRLDRGEQLVGVKMGFTSRAKMQQMGVEDLIWGRLTDAMAVADGGEISLRNFIHPRIEPEIAFRLAAPLHGTVTLAEARAAVDAVAPAMEIIDSRYQNFKFSLEDVVADNSSSSAFVIGPWQALDGDISALAMQMLFNDEIVQSGSSADILGDPCLSLVEAARLAAISGLTLEPGWVVLAGAATAAEVLRPGITVTVETERLGNASVHVAAAAEPAA